jgi:hypothetical protein
MKQGGLRVCFINKNAILTISTVKNRRNGGAVAPREEVDEFLDTYRVLIDFVMLLTSL